MSTGTIVRDLRNLIALTFGFVQVISQLFYLQGADIVKLHFWFLFKSKTQRLTLKRLMRVVIALHKHFGRREQFAHACGGFGLCGPKLSQPEVLSPRDRRK